MILEWGNCSKQPKQQQQQHQQNGNKSAPAAAAVSKAAASLSPQMTASLAPGGLLQAGRVTAAQPGFLLVAPRLQLQQQQQQQQTVLVLPQGYTLTPRLVAGGAPGQLVFMARY
jgi:hypothetical protein